MTDTTHDDFIANVSANLAAHDTAKGPAVLMTRNPKAGGKGVSKMLVPADQVEDFKAAGWTVEA